MSEIKTTIQVSGEVWEALNKQLKIGESFEDVLRRVLGLSKSKSAKRGRPKKKKIISEGEMFERILKGEKK